MVIAHEADLLYTGNFSEEITKNKCNQGGLTLKDLKPDTFESNEKSKLSFRQWSHEFSSWVERIDQDFETMLRLAAQMQEWDKHKFIAEAQQDCRLGAEKVAEFDKHIFLAMKRLTAGVAREIVDISKTAVEAWYRLTDRFYGRNVPGATAFANQLQELKRPTQIAEPFSFAERDQEVGQKICSTISKRTDVQRHRQSGIYETGPRDLPQSDGTQVDVDKLSLTTWKKRSLFSSETTHPALHQWILETLHQHKHRHQVLAVPTRVPRQAHTGDRTVTQIWTTMSMHHNGDKIGTLAMPTHLEVQMVSCTACRKAKGKAKGGKAKGKGKKGDSKGWNDSKGWTARKGWSDRKGWNTSGKGWEPQRPAGMNKLERDSKQYDVVVTETSTQEKTKRDSDWCVPVKHVAKLNRIRGPTPTKTNIKFFVDPEEEDRDNDTTPDCLGSKQFVLEDDVSHKCSRCEAVGTQGKRTRNLTHQDAKCTFFQLDRCRHQFLREGEYGLVRASTKHLGVVAKASGCRFRSWRNRHARRLADQPSFDRVRWFKNKWFLHNSRWRAIMGSCSTGGNRFVHDQDWKFDIHRLCVQSSFEWSCHRCGRWTWYWQHGSRFWPIKISRLFHTCDGQCLRGYGMHNDWNSRDFWSKTFGERTVLESVFELSIAWIPVTLLLPWCSLRTAVDSQCILVCRGIRVFQAYVAVNVKTGGMFLRITQNGESVPALVALWCADKRPFARARLTRTVVYLQSCDRSQFLWHHDVSCMAPVKKSSAVCCTHTSHIFKLCSRVWDSEECDWGW